METEMKNIKEGLDAHSESNERNFKVLFEKIDALDGRFAPKVTLYIATGGFLTALGIIIALIVR